ncbi:MAG TPA: HEAT repeat domain-containing protein [Pirellulales bacterium]
MTWPAWTGLAKEEDDSGPKVLTPKDKIEQLRELTKKGPAMTPEMQEKVSAELAHGIPNEQDPMLRGQILRTLAVYKTDIAGKVLAAGVKDKDHNVRIAACEAWGVRGGPQAPEILGAALAHDESLDVRLAAARGLGKVAHPNAIAPLGHALDDPDPAMQHRVMLSLKEASGRDYGGDVGAWREFVNGGQPPVPEESFAQRFWKLF